MTRLPSFKFRDLGDGDVCPTAIPWRASFSEGSMTRRKAKSNSFRNCYSTGLLSELAGTCITFLSRVIFQLGMAFVPSQWHVSPRDALSLGQGGGRSIELIVRLPFHEEYLVEVQFWPRCYSLLFFRHYLSPWHPAVLWWVLGRFSQWLISIAGCGHWCWVSCY